MAKTDPAKMMESMIRNFPEKTGKSLDEWLEVIKDCPLDGHKQRVDWLKKEHGMTHGYSLMVVNKAKEAAEGGPKTGDEMVDAQFSGKKEGLRPVYDRLIAEISRIADDIEILPRKTCVTLSCGRKFGTVQSTSAGRLDLGLRIPDVELTGKLEKVKNFDPAQMTCQVSLIDPSDIDDELIGWIKTAYENRK